MKTHLHVVGSSPRSGTTLLFELLSTSFSFDSVCEHESRVNILPSNYFSSYLSKKPSDFLVTWLLLPLIPSLKVISIVRDPRDSICSMRADSNGLYWCSLKFWKSYSRLRPLHSLFRHSRFLEIKYEDLCNDPNSIQDLIDSFIPEINAICKFSSYGKAASISRSSATALNGVRSVSSSSVNSWKRHKQRVSDQIFIHGSISDSLIKYGYEYSNDWELLISGFNPSTSINTYSSEFWTLRQIYRALISIPMALISHLFSSFHS